MLVPLMSSMTEVSLSAGLGLSNGVLYKFTYGKDEANDILSVISLSGIPNNSYINDVCKVNDSLFVATNLCIH
jgi:hypothetical protein